MRANLLSAWLALGHGAPAQDSEAIRLTALAPATPHAPSAIALHLERGPLVGQVDFRLCHTCRTGRIQRIWINETWQRQGLGRQALHSALAQGPDYRWNTTMQSRQGRAFFRAMAAETGAELSSRTPPCPHLMGRYDRLWRRVRRALRRT
ncbi:GNAT family N-acetyltransferase [Streptomyces sp. NRRL B-1347]|uniref:GNAT family N-acetyltransferase n=1 Tax=Streptomyces sp. NRRL B-1347 TaxID=1476877 RepID=UPI0006897916|nr:GNAT family N-acetyltransferase [Streptomyces sp. NRRL B-1347]